MKFYLRRSHPSKALQSEGREEPFEMLGGATVLSEIIKSTVMRTIPRGWTW